MGGAPPHTAGLRSWTVELPSGDEVQAVRERLLAARAEPRDLDGGGLEVSDPWGTTLRIVSAG